LPGQASPKPGVGSAHSAISLVFGPVFVNVPSAFPRAPIRSPASAMSVKSVAHVCLKTTDLARTADFYCGALGLTRHFNFTRKGKIIGAYFSAGHGTFVEVFLVDEVERLGRQVLNHFCLETDALAALRESLVARGLAVGEIKLGADGSPQFWMKDPNGLDLEFQEYTPQSAQRTGRDVEVDW
jgi:catechol 2,3-dioxygenase-like lactoylglutathione lyase family enzyme